ncbi:MAG: potassium channel protein [archaeon]|nr:potassium channel protein [archaeon]
MNKVESMLLELKDTSEFMVDLAYSSLLYNNAEIAEEVLFLKTKMDDLSNQIQQYIENTGKEHPDEITKFTFILRLQMAIEEIANAATSIADVVLRGLGEHPVIQMSIQESEATIEVATVAGESSLVDKTLGEKALGSRTGMYVMAIKRGNQYVYGPGKDSKISLGDTLIAKGPKESADHFINIAKGTEKL